MPKLCNYEAISSLVEFCFAESLKICSTGFDSVRLDFDLNFDLCHSQSDQEPCMVHCCTQQWTRSQIGSSRIEPAQRRYLKRTKFGFQRVHRRVLRLNANQGKR